MDTDSQYTDPEEVLAPATAARGTTTGDAWQGSTSNSGSFGATPWSATSADGESDTGGTMDQVQQKASQVLDQVQRKASDIVDTAQEQATSQLGQQKEQATSQLGTVSQAMNQVSQQLRQNNQEGLAQVADQASQVARQAQQQAGRAGDWVQQAWQERPLALGAIAVATGLAAGLMIPVTE